MYMKINKNIRFIDLGSAIILFYLNVKYKIISFKK